MSTLTESTNETFIAQQWLQQFGNALETRKPDQIADLVLADGHWRDLLAFTWHLFTVSGRQAIIDALESTIDSVKPRDFQLGGSAPARTATRSGREVIELMFAFESEIGECSGVARLVEDDDGEFRAWSFMTNLEQIRGHEEQIDDRRPTGLEWSRGFGGPSWHEVRESQRAFTDREPEVLVVGGGQCGLAMAARLGRIGVDALVIEKNPRIGDNWRNRYRSLALHNESWVCQFPYLPFPASYPKYIPKDMLANWMEFYVDALEINAWTDTELLDATFDDASHTWTVTVQQGDESRVLNPTHIVMATGVSGKPIMPDLPGLDAFEGRVSHAAAFRDGRDYEGKRVVIFGVGTSGHDVAQELHACGADVTMVQRGSITVANVESAQAVYALYREGLPTHETDRLLLATPYAAQVEGYQALTGWLKQVDASTLEGLQEIGMELDFGHDDTGFQMKYMRRGGGYYLNVGCSELLIDGSISLLQYRDISQVTTTGLELSDGTDLAADCIIIATGYENQGSMMERLFGAEVASRVGQVWGWDEGGEVANMWKRTPQPNLYFHAGSLAQSRILSKHLALQIKARQLGLIDSAVPRSAALAQSVG